MRRLPIFFVIDVSESMVGEAIEEVNSGLLKIYHDLMSNPIALETVYVSVIVFAGKAKTIIPLTELLKFNFIELPIGGGTALGEALEHLMDELDATIIKNTPEQKGDWKPLIFLLTDGQPTDNFESAIIRWNNYYRKSANLIAIAVGDFADPKILSKLTPDVVILRNTEPNSLKKFFRWISSSIETKSINVNINSVDSNFVNGIDNEIMTEYDKNLINQNVLQDDKVILLLRCQNHHFPYLVKFKKEENGNLNLIASYKISEKYFELSGEDSLEQKINVSTITQHPTCPYCGNNSFVLCACGHLFCYSGGEKATCPWCQIEIGIEIVDDFEINKTDG